MEKVDSASIVFSIDSGCKETFEKIKGTKFYDLVNKNMQTYLSHSRKKDFVIPKFILLTEYNDTAEEIEKWLYNCSEQGYVEVQFDAEHTVSSSEECENKKYVKRTLNMLEYAEKKAKDYNIKVTSFLAFMNRAKNMFEKQTEIFGKDEKDYSNLFDRPFEETETKVQNNELAPFRRIKTVYSKQNREKLLKMLRLGFDFDLTVKGFVNDSIIDEILKTSNSKIISSDIFSKIYNNFRYKN